ncbi:MAG: hypothetical protein R3A12_11360 [Ignavibacteria bacterium]
MIILFFVFLILLTSFKITGDDDVFWHLATGRYIVETQHVPSTDIFGFVTEGQEWMPFEWGWDVITYGLFNIGGYNAILVFRTIIFVLIFLLFFLILRKFKVSHTLIFFSLHYLHLELLTGSLPVRILCHFCFLLFCFTLITEYRYFKRKL